MDLLHDTALIKIIKLKQENKDLKEKVKKLENNTNSAVIAMLKKRYENRFLELKQENQVLLLQLEALKETYRKLYIELENLKIEKDNNNV